ncbi:DUF402 domain-containing protein [Brevibacterium sp. 91QC2O2]|uniref:DUF402 domain-containing protein n=1 Tax=Brevibacterium TaxID=1696 RepID=UPI00211B9401|nr:DUF402 domain-containing protein [Brevibacterium sp. 91QC2O2]MCQ9386548.1 DUF402 domain-containing protein [Brevibacterium sp. 68QC2CO]
MRASGAEGSGASESVRGATDPFGLELPVGTRPVASGPYLEHGDVVRWHFRRHDYPRHLTEVVQPLRVVAHDERGIVLWLAGDSVTVESRLVGYADINPHLVPFDVRFVPDPPTRVQVPGSWYGSGVLRIVPADSPFSVWVFRDRTGAHKSWYINLEQQHRLLDSGDVGVAADLFTADHILDVVVRPDGSRRFKDEDELAGAVEFGMWTPRITERIRANSQIALAALEDGAHPAHWAFSPEWTRWRAPETWGPLGV